MPELLDWLTSHDDSFRASRLASLYSDFQRQKAVNPDGYRANIQTWQNGLSKAIRGGASPGNQSILSLNTGPKLLEALNSRQYGTPSALAAVLQESVAGGQFIPSDTFLSAKSSIYDKNWIPSASTVVTWALGQVGLAGLRNGPSSHGSYVVLANVEEAGRKLSSVTNQNLSRIQRLMPMQSFRSEASKALELDSVSEQDLSIILVYLARDKKCISYNKDVVKIHATGETRSEITGQDVEIASLKDLSSRLSEQHDELSSKVESLNQRVKERLAVKDRAGALRALRSVKAHEAVLDRRSANLEQVSMTLSKIEEAADQVEIVKAMEGSASVLRGLTSETGGRDNVEQIMDRLQEEVDKADDIGAIIRESAPGANNVDETEIDEMLEQLEAESKQRAEAARDEETHRRLAEIPSVPSEAKSQEQPRPEASTESDLTSSISALNRLSLEVPAHEQGQQKEDPQAAMNLT